MQRGGWHPGAKCVTRTLETRNGTSLPAIHGGFKHILYPVEYPTRAAKCPQARDAWGRKVLAQQLPVSTGITQPARVSPRAWLVAGSNRSRGIPSLRHQGRANSACATMVAHLGADGKG